VRRGGLKGRKETQTAPADAGKARQVQVEPLRLRLGPYCMLLEHLRVCLVMATYGGAFLKYDVGPARSRSVMRPAHKPG
jgi:hypothetical protein